MLSLSKFIYIILFSSLCLNAYFYIKLPSDKQIEGLSDLSFHHQETNKKRMIEEELKDKSIDKIETTQSSIKKETNQYLITTDERLGSISEETLRKQNEIDYYDYRSFIETWNDKVRDFFVIELGMTEEEYNDFEDIKIKRSRAVDEYLVPLIQKHEERNGKNTSYFITPRHQKEIDKITDIYNQKFEDQFGTDVVERYYQLRESFNQMSSQAQTEDKFYIDF